MKILMAETSEACPINYSMCNNYANPLCTATTAEAAIYVGARSSWHVHMYLQKICTNGREMVKKKEMEEACKV
jgi:hypothetical protein